MKKNTIRDRSNRLQKKLHTGKWAESYFRAKGELTEGDIEERLELSDAIFDIAEELNVDVIFGTSKNAFDLGASILTNREADIHRLKDKLLELPEVLTIVMYHPVDAYHSEVWDLDDPFAAIESRGTLTKDTA